MNNGISFRLTGDLALFTDPMLKIGGEKATYQVPTYGALKGVLTSIYWKPTFIWVIDRVRVINPIRNTSIGVRPISYHGGNTLSAYTYLSNVSYQIEAHFEWNMFLPQFENDRNLEKHAEILKKSLNGGGTKDIFLGTRECQGYVFPETFGSGLSYYDEIDLVDFGLMFHSFGYPNETGINSLTSRFHYVKMESGVINFTSPERCPIVKVIKPATPKTFTKVK